MKCGSAVGSKGSLETGCQELGKGSGEVTEVVWSKYMTKCKLLAYNFIINYHLSTKLLLQEKRNVTIN